MEEQTESQPDFYSMVDKFIDLANQLTRVHGSANVSAMIMFAAARFNAHCLLLINPKASEHPEPALDHLQQEFRAMLEENIDWLSEARKESGAQSASDDSESSKEPPIS